ncbi:hypothetical protein ABIE19_002747 [Brevundimonas faecalis]|uniref:Uncharacterized protein n=1 Tax=Brevundimonas faecalis TaxID=947378 RepID=A0ABV2REU5_9CAUL
MTRFSLEIRRVRSRFSQAAVPRNATARQRGPHCPRAPCRYISSFTRLEDTMRLGPTCPSCAKTVPPGADAMEPRQAVSMFAMQDGARRSEIQCDHAGAGIDRDLLAVPRPFSAGMGRSVRPARPHGGCRPAADLGDDKGPLGEGRKSKRGLAREGRRPPLGRPRPQPLSTPSAKVRFRRRGSGPKSTRCGHWTLRARAGIRGARCDHREDQPDGGDWSSQKTGNCNGIREERMNGLAHRQTDESQCEQDQQRHQRRELQSYRESRNSAEPDRVHQGDDAESEACQVDPPKEEPGQEDHLNCRQG